MCKEMNAPVLPESKKVNATITATYDLSAHYRFAFTTSFISSIQMNAENHECLCLPSTPMTHYCCPGCRDTTTRDKPNDEDMKDLKAVLGDYNFEERDAEKVLTSLLALLIRTLPLSLYTYSRAHYTHTRTPGLPTLFLSSISTAHRFAAHLAHACEDYYYHEEYLHSLYHGAMYDRDWSTVTATHVMMAHHQAGSNRLHRRVMMGYLGGGVGFGYVGARGLEIEKVLEEEKGVDMCSAICGVYLVGERKFKAAKLQYVPHEPILGEVVKWSSEWIGEEGVDDEDEEGI